MVYIFVFLAVVLCYCLFVLPTQWLKIERVHQPLGLHKTILQISDLHVERLRISPGRLRDVIRQVNPDYIFLTGDFTRKDPYIRKLVPYLVVFRDSGCPTFAVLGNHDYQLARVDDLLNIMAKHHIRVLRNESIDLKVFSLIGIDDGASGHSDVAQSFQSVRPSVPKIVITHDPNAVLAIHEPFAYFMAGHFHGKQFNVPFLFTLKPMGPLPAKGIYKGLHQNAYGPYYISKGIGQTGFNFRFLIRSEITIHHL